MFGPQDVNFESTPSFLEKKVIPYNDLLCFIVCSDILFFIDRFMGSSSIAMIKAYECLTRTFEALRRIFTGVDTKRIDKGRIWGG